MLYYLIYFFNLELNQIIEFIYRFIVCMYFYFNANSEVAWKLVIKLSTTYIGKFSICKKVLLTFFIFGVNMNYRYIYVNNTMAF